MSPRRAARSLAHPTGLLPPARMDPESWRRMETAFLAALDLPAEQRDAWLRETFADDPALQREALAILAAHHAAGDSLAAHHLLPALHGDDTPTRNAGDRIGVWRIEGLVGRGGMGEVYRAARADDAYQQQVAIKVMRSGRGGADATRRFLAERQILATLQHPGIATLLDGGVTADGDPYLVMQFVEGAPITTYASTHGLSLEARVRLLVAVAEAVQYAHGNLVVHRDLKPSNILVTPAGQPRILDFGIASLVRDGAAGGEAERLLYLTPEHAAPEQFLGDPVTTATDVYALGVLLYEMVAGERPFAHLPAADVGRAVCEVVPAPPSMRAPRAIAPRARGDLDLICGKALAKDPMQRYASAGQFAEDLGRFLAREPVLAHPTDLTYRARCFVRRNAALVGGAGIVVATLVGAVLATTREAGRRADALRIANAERATATRVADFLLDVFSATDPSEARGRTVTARELLDRAAVSIGTGLRDEPAIRADLSLAIGRAYQSLGLAATAAPLIDSAAVLQQARTPSDPRRLALALEWQGRNAFMRGRPADGVDLVRRAVALREASPSDSLGLGRALTALASLELTLDFRDSARVGERDALRALTLLRRLDPPPHRDIAMALRAVGQSRADRAPKDALAPLREAVDEARKAVGEDDPFLFNISEGLGIMYQVNGHADSAIAIGRRLLAARERVVGPAHPDYAFSLYNLARTLARSGQFAEGLALFQRAIDVRTAALGPTHYLTGVAWHSFAVATAQAGDLPLAGTRFEHAAGILRASVGPSDRMLQDALEGVAIVRAMQGRVPAALDALEAAAAAGYRRPARLAQPPFDRLAREPRFQRLLTSMGGAPARTP